MSPPPAASFRLAQGTEFQLPGATIPAPIDEYRDWLYGYIQRGGQPTHFYDYPFDRVGFELAIGEAIVNGCHEYGARSRQIIVGKYARLALLSGGHDAFGGWAHTKAYFLADYSTPHRWVPVYSDAEFDEILTGEQRAHRAREAVRQQQVRQRYMLY